MNYTPGPWVCRPTIGPGDELLEAVISKSAGNVTVANDCLPEDADLIAAAPDLLEALKVALALVENGDFSNGVTEYGVDEGVEVTRPLISQIEAAIAKAEGRQ